MHFIDLGIQQDRIKKNIDNRIQKVLNHGKYIMGPEVGELEKILAKYVGVKHAIACASGTDALFLSLLSYGIGPGDAILTSPFTFIATAEVVSILGATPVFVDVNPETFNIDPQKLNEAIRIAQSKSLKVKGIIAVDIFGLPAEYDLINEIAEANGFFVIEDAAQSLGAEYKGKKACSLANVACTSFFPAKPLGCYGDGGMCFTNDDSLAEIIRSLLVHGKGSNKYDNIRVGVNGRLDTLQAAILLAKFDIFPEEVGLRQQVAQQYSELLDAYEEHRVIKPKISYGFKSAWAQYSLLTKDEEHRAVILAELKKKDIPTAIYYPKPLHLQTAFTDLGYKSGDFPVSEDISNRVFSIPFHPYLKSEDQELIISIINQA